MVQDCEWRARGLVGIGSLPGRFSFGHAYERVYRAERPLRFVAKRPEACEPGFDYLVVKRFLVEIRALRINLEPDGVFSAWSRPSTRSSSSRRGQTRANRPD